MQRLIADIKRELAERPGRSAWEKGVRGYAEDLFTSFIENKRLPDDARIGKITEADLLNGAESWEQYSYGGCAEVYDSDICERLCSPSEQKKTKGGELPFHGESWVDAQAKALKQAARIVLRVVNRRD